MRSCLQLMMENLDIRFKSRVSNASMRKILAWMIRLSLWFKFQLAGKNLSPVAVGSIHVLINVSDQFLV